MRFAYFILGRILFEVMDWDAISDDDLIGGFSISIQAWR